MHRLKLLLALGLTFLLFEKGNAQVHWTSRIPKAPIYKVADVLSTGPLTIANDWNGKDLASVDGNTWTEIALAPGSRIRSMVWTGAQFVAVGNFLPVRNINPVEDPLNGVNLIFTSPDGITWTQRKTDIQGPLYCVIWTGKQLVAGGDSGRVYTSNDGIVWKNVKVMDDNEHVYSLAWTGSKIVAAGDYNFFTSTDGKEWTRSNTSFTASITSIFWTGTQLVAVDPGYSIQTSYNGQTWIERNTAAPANLVDITWNGKQLVALDDSGIAYTSPDALKWTRLTSDGVQAAGMAFLTWNGKQLIAMSHSGAIFTSPDGITWTNRRGPERLPPNLYSVVASKSQSVAVGQYGAVLSSPDGVTWTDEKSGTDQTLRAVTWTGTQFYAVGDTGVILASPDGVAWTIKKSGILNNLKCVFWTGSQFIVGGADGIILTSPDGNAWTIRNSGTNLPINSIVGNGTQLVAVGGLGIIHTSPDGITWTWRPSGAVYPFLSVTWTGFQFVAVGGSEKFPQGRTSPDGITWSSQNMQLNGFIPSVVWSGSLLVAFTPLSKWDGFAKNIVSTSLDGRTWRKHVVYPSQLKFNSLTWTGTQYIAVGNEKAIFIAPQIYTTEIVNLESVRNSLSIRVSQATLSLTVPNEMLDEKIKISIYSITGKRVLDRIGEKSLGHLSVPVQKLPMGRYLLEVSGSKRKLSKTFFLMP